MLIFRSNINWHSCIYFWCNLWHWQ